eukprot:3925285-Rhodomonas_salina.1
MDSGDPRLGGGVPFTRTPIPTPLPSAYAYGPRATAPYARAGRCVGGTSPSPSSPSIARCPLSSARAAAGLTFHPSSSARSARSAWLGLWAAGSVGSESAAAAVPRWRCVCKKELHMSCTVARFAASSPLAPPTLGL